MSVSDKCLNCDKPVSKGASYCNAHCAYHYNVARRPTGCHVIMKSGKFSCGFDCHIGQNVVVDVAEECIFGDRCVIPDNAYFGGRRIKVGNDFYGYSWEWKRLDIGRGRRDDEFAILKVGSRCTFHDNKIDLACEVSIGDDVGLSPEVAIYTHFYWTEKQPWRYNPVIIGNKVFVGFRSVILPGASIHDGAMIGAQSVVPLGRYLENTIYAGNPAKAVGASPQDSPSLINLHNLRAEYVRSRDYRKVDSKEYHLTIDYPCFKFKGCEFDVEKLTVVGEESADTDDFREFLFKHGIRIYTKRPFKKMPRRQ